MDKLQKADWQVLIALNGKQLPSLRRILAAMLVLFMLSWVLVTAGSMLLLRLALQLGFTPDQIGAFLGALVRKALGVP